MKLKTVQDLMDLKALGYRKENEGEYYQYVEFYKFTPEQIAPLFNLAEKTLGGGFYRDNSTKPQPLNKRR